MFKTNSAIHGGCIPSWCWSEMKADALDLGSIADSMGGAMKVKKYTSDSSNIPKGLRWVKYVHF